VHARGTRLMLEVMSVDELTVEASVRPLHVLDAPTVTSGAEEEEETEEEIIDAADESAESEAEAQAEADTAAAEGEQPADSNDSTQHATEQGQ
jgi:exoribonuclease-2